MSLRRASCAALLAAVSLSGCSSATDSIPGRGGETTSNAAPAQAAPDDAELPPIEGSLQELLVAPNSVPGLVFLPSDASSAASSQRPDARYDPPECAPEASGDNSESAMYMWNDGTTDFTYSVSMMGRDHSINDLPNKVRRCPNYLEITDTTTNKVTSTVIDAPQLEGAQSTGIDMATVSVYNDGSPTTTLRSSTYVAEVRGITFFVLTVSHTGAEITGEHRHRMDQLLEAQVKQLRFHGS